MLQLGTATLTPLLPLVNTRSYFSVFSYHIEHGLIRPLRQIVHNTVLGAAVYMATRRQRVVTSRYPVTLHINAYALSSPKSAPTGCPSGYF